MIKGSDFHGGKLHLGLAKQRPIIERERVPSCPTKTMLAQMYQATC